MKKFIYIYFLFFSFGIIYAQQASDYFPGQPGFEWEYRITPLDTNNTLIDSLTFTKKEFYTSITNIDGRETSVVLTKIGPTLTIDIQPYLDSLFFSFEGTNAYEYFNLGYIEEIIHFIDTLAFDSSATFLDFLHSFEQWYSVYRFSQQLGDDYTYFEFDTTVTLDSLIIPLRLELIGERLEDDSITTTIGGFNCKKFLRKAVLSYLFILPPLPEIQIPIASVDDTIWIAENKWIVQGIIPPIYIDLSFAGIEPFYIPGLVTKIYSISQDPVGVEDEINIPADIVLRQNYPNPFNPSTIIKFSISSPGFTTLKIYNTIGEEVAVLIANELTTGTYEFEWNASGLPSGVYFYQIKTERFIETKKMILLR